MEPHPLALFTRYMAVLLYSFQVIVIVMVIASLGGNVMVNCNWF